MESRLCSAGRARSSNPPRTEHHIRFGAQGGLTGCGVLVSASATRSSLLAFAVAPRSSLLAFAIAPRVCHRSSRLPVAFGPLAFGPLAFAHETAEVAHTSAEVAHRTRDRRHRAPGPRASRIALRRSATLRRASGVCSRSVRADAPTRGAWR